jgi:hypothetical protein
VVPPNARKSAGSGGRARRHAVASPNPAQTCGFCRRYRANLRRRRTPRAAAAARKARKSARCGLAGKGRAEFFRTQSSQCRRISARRRRRGRAVFARFGPEKRAGTARSGARSTARRPHSSAAA